MTGTRHKRFPSTTLGEGPNADPLQGREGAKLPSSVIDTIAAWAVAHAAKPPCPHCDGTGLKFESPAEREAHNRLLTHALNQALNELALEYTLRR